MFRIFNIHQSNKNLPPLQLSQNNITPTEAARLSLAAYWYGGKNLPENWNLFKEFVLNSCYCALYYKRTSNPNTTNEFYNDIVFAFRGTDSLSNTCDNVNVILGKMPFMAPFIDKFCKESLLEFTEKFGPYRTILHTGHSLGAVYADLMAACAGWHDGTITFENPGSRPIIKDAVNNGFLGKSALNYDVYCNNFLSDVNIINTCNKQFCLEFYRLKMPYKYDVFKQEPIFKIQRYALSNSYYIMTYTIDDQHKIENIYNHLKNDGLVTKEAAYSNPVGFQNGYAAYLDVNKRSEYWKEYFKLSYKKYYRTLCDKYKTFDEYLDDQLLLVKTNHDLCSRSQDNDKNIKFGLFNQIENDKNISSKYELPRYCSII